MWKMVGIFNVSNSDLKIMIKEFGDLQRQKENLPSFPLRSSGEQKGAGSFQTARVTRGFGPL